MPTPRNSGRGWLLVPVLAVVVLIYVQINTFLSHSYGPTTVERFVSENDVATWLQPLNSFGGFNYTLIQHSMGLESMGFESDISKSLMEGFNFSSIQRSLGIDSNSSPPSMDSIQASVATKKPTIFCMIPYVWNPISIIKHKEIVETWGQRCDRIRFMVDPIVEIQKGNYTNASKLPPNTLPEDVIVVPGMRRAWHNCGDKPECRMIWEKVWRSVVLVDETEPKYDWYLKTDWDSYVFPDFILDYVQEMGWSSDDHHYFGHKDYHRPDEYHFISGALVTFSAKTFHELANVFRKMPLPEDISRGFSACTDSAGSHEEPLTAICLKDNFNVTSEHTRDEKGRERVMLFDLKFHLTGNKKEPWWYWKGKPMDAGELEYCCNRRPFCFHGHVFKGLGGFYRIENQLYGDNSTSPDHPHSDPAVQAYLSTVRQELGKIHK